jgi:mannose-6-phosphate isomerase-like protein (cupin superfamily)
MPTIVNKLWGYEDVVENNDLYCMKALVMTPGFQSSLHYHPVKDEIFLVIKGICELELSGETHRLTEGQHRRILPNAPHRFRAIDGVCVVVEAGTTHRDSDVVRLEDSRRIDE